ncbi:MAG: 3-octaprenyl-4-hydroxybenzoate carboxy-lyase, partial [Methylocystaceae bacterium]|nr:3-octaprenyl-4-hydroxybenzoate carboxy-lyase [Methylocystaceae bacterium]
MTLPLIVGISGASGVIYGVELLRALKEIGHPTHLVVSDSAQINLEIETDVSLEDVKALADVVHDSKNMGAAISSGSFKTKGMIIAPCAIKTLSGIA